MDGALGAIVVFVVMIVAVIAGMFLFTVFASDAAAEEKAKQGK